MALKTNELKEFLDEKVKKYNNRKFIENDPISIPHLFTKRKDIEIAGFLISIIAWGNRKSIINSGYKLLRLMDNSPYDFVMNHSMNDLESMNNFVHRTFNSEDLKFFIKRLKIIYTRYQSLESLFIPNKEKFLYNNITNFHNLFFSVPHPRRTRKHIANPSRNSAAKRINMFLRWMVRKDNNGVDFGLWDKISSSVLSCPLDLHSAKTARSLGLLNRNQNDLKALYELDTNLRKLDLKDPVKYDFALFGWGVFENF